MSLIEHLEGEMSNLSSRFDELSRRINSRDRESKDARLTELEVAFEQLMKVVSMQQLAIEELANDYADRNAGKELGE